MKCPQCNSDIGDDSKFCKECGTNITSVEEAQPPFTRTLETPIEQLTRGTLFAGRYEIIEELGKGGMGSVYRVEDTKISEEVALKLIKPEISTDRKTIERFHNELKITRKIRHKNVSGMFDIGEDKGTHYITMEYVPGEDLKSMIRMTGQLGIGTAIKIARQICDGLTEAHSLGVIHRDLKPSNIMIDKLGNARIMDFGIARSLEAKGITRAGVMIGTPEYMSPEQVEAKEVDQRSDIYSLGIMLYEMVTGRVPFEGDTALSIAMKHKSEEPQDPAVLYPQLPLDLGRLILKCLRKDKEERFQSARQVGMDLEKVEQGIPTTDKVIPKKRPTTSREITLQLSWKKAYLPALIIIGVVLAALVVWRLLPRSTPVRHSIAVISFENLTGDASNDNLRKIIPNLLITSLEQSGHFQVTTWSRMQDLLKQLGKDEVEFIDPDLGFEICRLDSIDAIVIGSVGKAGDMYATEVQVLDVETKELYKSANARGMGLESILGSQIDQLSRDISQGLGISRRISEAKQGRVSDVTTDSLEAYDLFLQGKEEVLRFNYSEARELLEKAVELDAAFAIGHLWLGFSYNALAMGDSRQEAFAQAFKHQDRATEQDRLLIQYQYAIYEEEDEEKGYGILLEMKEKYPTSGAAHSLLGGYYEVKQMWDEAIEEYLILLELDTSTGFASNTLGYLYLRIGENDKALDMFNRYAAILPDGANPLDSIAEAYFHMGRLEDAISKYQAALEAAPDIGSGIPLGYIHALREDYAEASAKIEQFIDKAPSPGIAVYGYAWEAFYCSLLGRFAEASDIMEETFSKSDSSGGESLVFELHWVKGWLAYERGDLELSRNYFTTYAEFMSRRNSYLEAYYSASLLWRLGRIDLKAGEIGSARSRFKELNDIFPEMQEAAGPETELRMTHTRDMFEAELLLAEGRPQRALDICKNVVPLAIPIGIQKGVLAIYNLPSERDTMARAFVKLAELNSAIQEYEKLITFDTGSQERRLIHPRFHYRLAMLYEQTGQDDKALQHYRKFLTLWKDADPGLPEVTDARERVAGLRRVRGVQGSTQEGSTAVASGWGAGAPTTPSSCKLYGYLLR